MGYNHLLYLNCRGYLFHFKFPPSNLIAMKKVKLILILTLVVTTLPLSTNAQQAQPDPCSSEKVHEFDFWIGEWDVYKFGTDTIVGHNVITPVANGCALMENWAGGGSVGNSLNKYNFAKGKWQQMWVDNSGGTLLIEGGYNDGKMIMENEQQRRDGKGVVKNRITWYNNSDGTVRQFWQQSIDAGKTWQVAFDGHYKKVKS